MGPGCSVQVISTSPLLVAYVQEVRKSERSLCQHPTSILWAPMHPSLADSVGAAFVGKELVRAPY